MTIPTRWHKPSCKTPQVVVDRNVPECRTCGGTASTLLQKAAEEPAPSYSGIKLPPDAPVGQMDLWWPPCVPYTRGGVPRTRPGASSEDAPDLAPQAPRSSLSEIYTSTLGKDQFRLLYLSGARAIDSPIHGDLVEYQRENCPEYETTSYTWGGEDGDAAPSKSAYFGDFWDVLFLTKNCWSLLRYLRPHMGTRVVWVDAICINQNNIRERGEQVSSMPQIYRKCMRVVIYAGDHLVRKEEHRFRQTIRHDDIMKHGDEIPVDDSGLDIRGSILQSRYISRLWIIQELILAPHAILALRDHDLYLSNNFLHCISRQEDGRKWLEFMGQDYKLRHATLYEGLRKTIDSQATDPRDRIFGILGLLGPSPANHEIVPDYSISMRHCIIGAMGLTVINSKEMWPLMQSQTSNTTSRCPSWVPNLDEIATWEDEESHGRRPRLEFIHSVPGEWSTAIRVARIPKKVWSFYSGLPLYPSEPVDAGRSGRHREPQLSLIDCDTPWFQDASIDSDCGALTLRLVRVFQKPHKIIEKENNEGIVHFVVEGPSTEAWFPSANLPQKPDRPCHMFLAFRGQTPEPDMRLDNDPSRLQTSDIYFLFATQAEATGCFNLVSCFSLDNALFLSASPQPPPFLLPLGGTGIDDGKACRALSLFETLHQSLNFDVRKHSLPGRKSNIRPRWIRSHGRISEAMLFDMIVPGNDATASGFLQLSLSAARAGESATVTEEFRQAYTACLQASSPEFKPVLCDEYVWFTLLDYDAFSHYSDSLLRHLSDLKLDWDCPGRLEVSCLWRPWDMIFPPWFDLQIPEIGKSKFWGSPCVDEVRVGEQGQAKFGPSLDRCYIHQDYDPFGHMRLHYWLPCTMEPRELQMPVRARMPLRKVVEAIRATELNWLHRNLLAFSEKFSEDVEALLEREPRPEDSNVYLHDWPKPLVDELGFVWRNELVTFV